MPGLRTLEEQPTMMMGQLKTLVVELMKAMPQKWTQPVRKMPRMKVRRMTPQKQTPVGLTTPAGWMSRQVTPMLRWVPETRAVRM